MPNSAARRAGPRGGIKTGKYFGTDGFRGRAGTELTAEHAYKIGRFLGGYFGRGARVVIGKDTRRSSYMLEYSLVAGLTSAGADGYIMHVTTTASVSYITRTDGFDCGIMISASHNPFYDNGIKLMGAGGEKPDDKTLAAIESYLDGAPPEGFEERACSGGDIGRSVDYVSGRNRYIGHLISLSACSFKGMRIGLDCANGSAWQIAKSVFDALGAKTYLIGGEPDGLNINTSGSTAPAALCELVEREGLDAGFAFDGDADRCIAVDERGRVVDGDGELFILANRLKELGEMSECAVCTVMSNSALISALAARGIKCAVTKVGDRFVYQKMCRTGAALGGEKSGHIIISKYGASGDGLVTAIKLLEAAAERGAKLSHLLRGYEPIPQIERSVRVQNREEVFNKQLLIFCDGVCAAERCARIVVRPSGTEPVIRLMAEGPSHEACARCLDRIERYLAGR